MTLRKSRCGLYLFAILIATSASSAALSPPIFRNATSQFAFLRPVNVAPDIPLRTIDGATARLSQLRGKVVVLNFWATWCLPCAAEMPSLERLAASRSADRVAVVAVSIDDGGPDTVKRFLSLNGIRNLLVYLDPDQRLGSLYPKRAATGLLTLYGLPASYVVDRNGLVVGYIVGAAKWDSPEANRFLDHFLSSSYRPER